MMRTSMNILALRRVGMTLVVILSLLAGCSRSHYRQLADQEAELLIAQKSNDPRWALPGFSINVDPRSRFYDPYDPDYPPMPPDDPASHRLMHRVDGKKGYKYWHEHGNIKNIENPCWQQHLATYVEFTDEGAIRLNLDESVKLALLHATRYQQQLETLYLSALDVSTERFRFDVQFFGSEDLTFEHLGSERLASGESNTLTADTDLFATRQFATAGELLVGFANSTVWEFFGPNTGVTTSLLNFSLVQPLLRAGGRAVALEQLTIAERGLLANLRAFQQYRQGFYARIAVGEDSGVDGPQRRGGFFGGTGLTGFSGTGSGGFGGVGAATGFGRGGLGSGADAAGAGGTTGFVGGGAGQVGGYIGLLQQLQQIRNTEDSLGAQLRTLALLEATLDAGLIDIAQVDQFRQNIESERANLLQAQNNLQTSLDTFKTTTINLPPDLEIELDDSIIRPFQLIDPRTREVQKAIDAFIDKFGDHPREPELEALHDAFAEIRLLEPRITNLFEQVQEDLDDLETTSPTRTEGMTAAERRLYERDINSLFENIQDLKVRFAQTIESLRELEAGLTAETRIETADTIVARVVDFSNVAGELSLVQARARLEEVHLDAIELTPHDALAIARANRLDWMNNRAALVDTWRLIEFNANALKSDLTVRFTGEMLTLGGDNPVKFRDETGTLRASLEFDAPLTRLIERNNFRQQLIDYQQDRRQLIRFEDRVHRDLRDLLRTLDQLAQNLEIQRRAVGIAIRRVDQTRNNLNRPVPPAVPGQPPPQFGPTAATVALTALSDLRSSQNNFMSVWLNYYAARMTLMLQLGLMEINERGLWVDVPLEEAIQASYADCPLLPPEIPDEWIPEESESFPVDEFEVTPPPAPQFDGPALEPSGRSSIDEAPGTVSEPRRIERKHGTVARWMQRLRQIGAADENDAGVQTANELTEPAHRPATEEPRDVAPSEPRRTTNGPDPAAPRFPKLPPE
jgi:hypothetical protein